MLCIYTITNTRKNRVYVGSAVSVSRRFSEHRKHLAHNTHPNRFLQNDWNASGCENFRFETVELVVDPSDLLSVEQRWIDRLYDGQDRCYNICRTAGSHLGCKRTDETKRKQSLASLGRPKSLEHVAAMTRTKREQCGRVIHQYTLEGKFVATFPAIKNASKMTGIASASIADIAKGKRGHAGGFLWTFDSNHDSTFLVARYLEFTRRDSLRKSTLMKQRNQQRKQTNASTT